MANSRKTSVKVLDEAIGKAQAGQPAVYEEDYRRAEAESRALTLAQVSKTIELQAPFLIPTFEQLQSQIYRAMHANGFWGYDQDNFGSKVSLVHSELSEMLEANRKSIDADDKIPEFTGEEAEAADVIIRLLDMAGRYNWRLGEAIVAKMQFNMTRPFKHDKKY